MAHSSLRVGGFVYWNFNQGGWRLEVNGVGVKLAEPISMAQFVREQGVSGDKVAVGMNGQLVPKATFGEVMVDDQAVVEVVSFVGGG